jgi:hypothetical protein
MPPLWQYFSQREATPERVGPGNLELPTAPDLSTYAGGQADGGDGRGAPQARLVRGSQTRSAKLDDRLDLRPEVKQARITSF